MRILSTLKNSIYALLSYALLAGLALLIRKVFLDNLSLEFLGYEGLFGNVFSLMALADLGIETIILYRLFPAVAKSDHSETSRILAIYKCLYRWIGLGILAFGICLSPFIKYLTKDNNIEQIYIYFIYYFQLMTMLCTYFLAYKRLIYIVNQQEYVCTKVDTIVSILFSVIKIVVLFCFKSYILYLLCNLLTNLISNIVISSKTNNNFRYLDRNVKVTYNEIKELGIEKEIKNNIIQKISGTIYGGTDNIVISVFLGIGTAGLFANYTLIQGYITTLFSKLLKPFQMSIGNYIYSKNTEEGYYLFRMFDFISFIFASVIAICYIVIINPFVSLWIGEQYLLSVGFVIAFAVNQYILWNHQFVCYYRSAFGKYEIDKYPILIAALLNVVISIILCHTLGMIGIIIGTVVGHFGFWIGRVRVVYSEYINEKVYKYIWRQIIRAICFILEVIMCMLICGEMQVSLFGIIGRLAICICIPTLLNVLLFFNTLEIKMVRGYLKKTVYILRNKMRENKDTINADENR